MELEEDDAGGCSSSSSNTNKIRKATATNNRNGDAFGGTFNDGSMMIRGPIVSHRCESLVLSPRFLICKNILLSFYHIHFMPLCFYIFPFDFVDAMHIRGDTLAIYQTHTHKYATFGTSIIIIISHYE